MLANAAVNAIAGLIRSEGTARTPLQQRAAMSGSRVFDALAEGGEIQMPFEATFWSPGFGMLADRWGTPWMVNVGPEDEDEDDPARAT